MCLIIISDQISLKTIILEFFYEYRGTVSLLAHLLKTVNIKYERVDFATAQ